MTIYKTILPILFFIFTRFLQAQLAPDFQFKDIVGNGHHLYSYLNEGKVVLIDFSTTWCKPCWKIHQSHFLNKMITLFGPNGTNQLEVLFIECDSTTNIEDLQGTGTNTLGDWTDGSTYPIIDLAKEETNILNKNNYEVLGFPTLIMVSPLDSTRNEYNLFDDIPNLEKASSILFNLIEPKKGKDLQVSLIETVNKTCSSVSVSFYAVNPTNKSFKNPKFQLALNGNVYKTINYEGTIDATSVNKVTFDDVSIDLNSDLTIEVRYIGVDDNATNNSTSTLFKSIVTDDQLYFSVQTNKYTLDDNSQIIIYNEDGKPVYNSGILEPNTLFESKVKLNNQGCHEIVLYDEIGDGFGNPISIVDESNKLLFFGTNNLKNYKIPFFVNSTASTQSTHVLLSLSLFPNPAKEYIKLKFNTEKSIEGSIKILNQLGQSKYISTLNTFTRANFEAINISNLKAGIYFIQFLTENKLYSKKFIKI